MPKEDASQDFSLVRNNQTEVRWGHLGLFRLNDGRVLVVLSICSRDDLRAKNELERRDFSRGCRPSFLVDRS